MPRRAPVASLTSATTSDTWWGSMPPLVSHRATSSAPASIAVRITSIAYSRTPGGAERGQRCRAQRELLLCTGEELRVLGVGAGPAALDETDPELVQEP